MSQIGRHGQHTLGRHKKAVSAKQDDRTRQSHKGRLESIYTKAVRQRSKDGESANQCKTENGTQSRTNDEATDI